MVLWTINPNQENTPEHIVSSDIETQIEDLIHLEQWLLQNLFESYRQRDDADYAIICIYDEDPTGTKQGSTQRVHARLTRESDQMIDLVLYHNETDRYGGGKSSAKNYNTRDKLIKSDDNRGVPGERVATVDEVMWDIQEVINIRKTLQTLWSKHRLLGRKANKILSKLLWV